MVLLPAHQRNAAPDLRYETYRRAVTITLAAAAGLPSLTSARWLTGWSPDVPVLVVAGAAAAVYALRARRLRERGGAWPAAVTFWFLAGGLGSLVVVACSFVGTYSRVLFWPLAVQDVLLLTLVPVGLTLGRPVALWRASRPMPYRSGPRPPGRLVRLLSFPLTGSVVAVAMLLSVYTTGWEQARLEHFWLLETTRFLLLAAGCGFLWPLLGVDEGSGRTSYPVRALVAFLDGLLDALPGLAVLGTGHVIAAGFYARVARSWGPSPARAADRRHGDDRAQRTGWAPGPARAPARVGPQRRQTSPGRRREVGRDRRSRGRRLPPPCRRGSPRQQAASSNVPGGKWMPDRSPTAARYGWSDSHDQDDPRA